MKFEKFPTLLVLGFLPILISLGFWQLDRAEQKRAFIAKQKQELLAPSMPLIATTPEDKEALRYKKVTVIGQYDINRQILVDNQISRGKAGYFVLTPFIIKNSNKAVLVNRGWIKANQDRRILPDLKIEQNQSQIRGRVNNFPIVGIKLAGADRLTEGWPSVVQVVEPDKLSERLGYTVFPFMIELDKELPEGYRREWHETTVMPPEQHVAYAAQWFGLAFLLGLLFVWYSRVK